MRNSRFALAAACLGVVGLASVSRGQVVINEFAYDTVGTDNREFVELYNSGASPVDISGWAVTGRDDAAGFNAVATIPGGTSIPAGGYYVVGSSAVANVNLVVADGFLEDGQDTVELHNGAVIVDAVGYETNKQLTFTGGGAVDPQIGPGYWGNYQGVTLTDRPTVSLGRYTNGVDTNNNGRDFGMRLATPGTTNTPIGTMTLYTPPDPTGQTPGTDVAGLTGSFVNARYIDPTVASGTLNPNVISAPSPTPGRAIIAWDNTGGGNGVTSNAAFGSTQGGFQISAYLDTSDMPQNFNGSNVNFTGSEVTIYGVGGIDALNNLTDLSGNIGVNVSSANATSGVAWVYERTAISGASPATQTLMLVDAGDGGDSSSTGTGTQTWTILQSLDISGLTSDWFELSIVIDAAGNGVASFNGTDYNFVTSTDLHSGAFGVAYRENTQIGADGTPDALMRPATFTILVPEPGSLALLGLGGLALARRRRTA